MLQKEALMQSDEITAAFGNWASSLRWDALPQPVKDMARRELLDIIGDMIAGRALLGVPPFMTAMKAWSGESGGCATVDGGRVPPAAACMINGYYAHGLELDDTHDGAVLHAGASVIPAVIAASEMRGAVSGKEMLEAIVCGIEIMCRLGVATDLDLVRGGWIYSALLGHFGAAAAAARILQNDAGVIARALGMAYVLTCGNHQSTREGAETKHLQPAIAGSNGLLAALMASQNVDAVVQPFLGEDGLNRVYLHERLDARRCLGGLGEVFETSRLSFKPYPSCRLTHPPVTAALELHQRIGTRLGEIKAITLRMGEQAFNVVGRSTANRLRPEKRLDAQFSAFWAVAVALAHGELMPIDLKREIPPSAEVSSLIAKTKCVGEAGEVGAREIGRCTLVAEMTDGTRHEVVVESSKGHPDNPLSEAELIRKFVRNLELADIPLDLAHQTARDILALDQRGDAAGLMRELSFAALRERTRAA